MSLLPFAARSGHGCCLIGPLVLLTLGYTGSKSKVRLGRGCWHKGHSSSKSEVRGMEGDGGCWHKGHSISKSEVGGREGEGG